MDNLAVTESFQTRGCRSCSRFRVMVALWHTRITDAYGCAVAPA